MNSECSKTGWVYFIMWKVSQDLSMLDILYNNFCPHILVRGYYFNSPFTYNLVLFWTFTEHCQAIPCVSEHFAVNSEHIMVWGKVNNISSMAFNKNNITWWTINTLVMRKKKYDAVCTSISKTKIYTIHVPEIQFSVSEWPLKVQR